jgi:hypothetical protein
MLKYVYNTAGITGPVIRPLRKKPDPEPSTYKLGLFNKISCTFNKKALMRPDTFSFRAKIAVFMFYFILEKILNSDWDTQLCIWL